MNDSTLTRYEEVRLRQQELADAAWKVFTRNLTPEQLSSLEAISDAGSSRQSGWSADVAESPLCSMEVDFAAAVDRPADVLQEVFGVSATQAEAIAGWHSAVVRRSELVAKEKQLSRIVGVLIRPMKDERPAITGLAMAAGLVGQMALNGLSSGADAARRMGKHRATLSHWKRKWQTLLDLKDETFGKSPSAREKYRERRLEVVARNKKKKSKN